MFLDEEFPEWYYWEDSSTNHYTNLYKDE